MADFLIHNQLSLPYIPWLFILGTPLLARCESTISFLEIKEGENGTKENGRVTFSLLIVSMKMAITS
jgi:hypothetical protein